MSVRFLLRRLQSLCRPQRVHDEIAEELYFHIDQRTAENMRHGMSPEAARREAERRFGHLTQIREQGYEVRGGGWLESFLQDVIYGCRVLRRNPAFATTGIITLALGIGVNAGLFAILQGVILRPLPYDHPDRLFMIRQKTAPGAELTRLSGPDFEDIYNQNHSFEKVANLIPYFAETLVGEGEPRNIKCTAITYDFFPMLGIQPLMGRLFTPQEYPLMAAPFLSQNICGSSSSALTRTSSAKC